LFSANVSAYRRQIRRLVREQHPSWGVIQCEAIADIDVTRASVIEQLDRKLNGRGATWRSSRCAAGYKTLSSTSAS